MEEDSVGNIGFIVFLAGAILVFVSSMVTLKNNRSKRNSTSNKRNKKNKS